MRRLLKSPVFYVLYLALASLLLLELAARAWFAFQIGPRVLAYGTPWYRHEPVDERRQEITEAYFEEEDDWVHDEQTMNTVYNHRNEGGGYLKFFPNEAKFHKDVDTREAFPVTINSHGFRGKEFTIEKPPGTIRVLTLGASSTVGLWSRDDETYPYQLELILNERCPGPERYEVINFAIPHAIADQIRSMFIAEGLALDPDVVTFYEGRNDSFQVHPMEWTAGADLASGPDPGAPLGTRVWGGMARTFLLARFVDEARNTNARVSAEHTLAILDDAATRTSREFIADLEQIREITERRGIVFIVANQQANSKSWYGLPRAERNKLKGVTYQDEVDQILALLEEGRSISGYEFNFLIHDRLMRSLEDWVREKRLPFVDVIELLDEERDELVSWVHLSPYANRKVAEAFADAILPRSCPAVEAGT